MILVLAKSNSKTSIQKVVAKLKTYGLSAVVSQGVSKTVIGVIGSKEKISIALPYFEVMKGVDEVISVSKEYKLVSLEFKPSTTLVNVGGITFGGKKIVVIAGPCAVENQKMLIDIARSVKTSGATLLRGGAFKPRTSPYAFQGLGQEGLEFLREAKRVTGLPIVTEIMDTRDLELGVEYADMIQIGARNMQNFNLLKEVGRIKTPVMLKRGLSATIKEFLMSAEYILNGGNFNVILCERGIRTFETATRNTLDLSAIPVLKSMTHLPVIVDPSHATGIRDIIPPMAKAAVACGADGLMIEVHHKPEIALCDGVQATLPGDFKKLMKDLKAIAKVIGREV